MTDTKPEFISYKAVINTLARAFTTGEQTQDACIARGIHAVGDVRAWLEPLVNRYLETFSSAVRPRQRDVERLLLQAAIWTDEDEPEPKRIHVAVHQWLTAPLEMRPIAVAANWNVPAIESSKALAEWCNTTVDELEWLADAKSINRKNSGSPLHHYHYRVRRKQSGGIRLIEAPQERLKQIQRKILSDILDRVPNYYGAAHGFVKGRSVKTFATPHVGKRVVLRMDLQDFFPRISRQRVQAIFRTLGYPEPVADTLGALCTNTTPHSVLRSSSDPLIDPRALFEARQLYCRPHLPQGAPTSPALANICAYRLDCRLTGLADWAGADYTRYADDIAFSGGDEFRRNAERYSFEIATIVSGEGWDIHRRKTRIMKSSVRQHLAGVVVNEKLNVTRHDYDTLKAILTNCARQGASSQNLRNIPNFRAHLSGRVAWVASVNANRGKRLTEILERIVW